MIAGIVTSQASHHCCSHQSSSRPISTPPNSALLLIGKLGMTTAQYPGRLNFWVAPVTDKYGLFIFDLEL